MSKLKSIGIVVDEDMGVSYNIEGYDKEVFMSTDFRRGLHKVSNHLVSLMFCNNLFSNVDMVNEVCHGSETRE
jgi:hypothetical protein